MVSTSLLINYLYILHIALVVDQNKLISVFFRGLEVNGFAVSEVNGPFCGTGT